MTANQRAKNSRAIQGKIENNSRTMERLDKEIKEQQETVMFKRAYRTPSGA